MFVSKSPYIFARISLDLPQLCDGVSVKMDQFVPNLYAEIVDLFFMVTRTIWLIFHLEGAMFENDTEVCIFLRGVNKQDQFIFWYIKNLDVFRHDICLRKRYRM